MCPVPVVLGMTDFLVAQVVFECTASLIVEICLVKDPAITHAELAVRIKVIKNLMYLWLSGQILVKPLWMISHHYLLLYGMVKGFFGSTWIAVYDLTAILVVLAYCDYNMSARITGIDLDI
jgi:hypothetical protein